MHWTLHEAAMRTMTHSLMPARMAMIGTQQASCLTSLEGLLSESGSPNDRDLLLP